MPGLVLIVEVGRPAAVPLAIPERGLELGRGVPDGRLADDDQVSRAHARVSVGQGGFVFEDLGSRNGSFLDGDARRASPAIRRPPALLRVGRSLLWAVADVQPFALGKRRRCAVTSLGRCSAA